MIRSPRPRLLLAALLLAAGCAGTHPGGTDGGGAGEGGTSSNWHWTVARTFDLGSDCTNAGAATMGGVYAWVTCTGDYVEGHGRLVRFYFNNYTRHSYPVPGAPGPVAVAGDSTGIYTMYVGDLADGRVTAMAVHDPVFGGASDPVMPCPSDPGKNLYDFIGGLGPVKPVSATSFTPASYSELLVSCAATNQVVRLNVSASFSSSGKTVLTASVKDRIAVGAAPGDMAKTTLTNPLTQQPPPNNDYIVLDRQGAAGSLVHADDTLSADVDRYPAGDTPNAVRVSDGIAYVVDSGSNSLRAFSLADGKPLFESSTGAGTRPWSLAVTRGKGEVLVTLSGTNEVAVFDASSGKLLQRLALPTGAALHPWPGKTVVAQPKGIVVTGGGGFGAMVGVIMSNLDIDGQPAGDGQLVLLEEVR